MTEQDSPFTVDHLSSRADNQHTAEASVRSHSFLITTTQSASTDNSPVKQDGLQFSINSSLPDDADCDEGNEIYSDADDPKLSRSERLHGRQVGFYSSSYPTHRGASKVSAGDSDLQQLVDATSHMNRLFKQGVSGCEDNSSHSTERQHIATSYSGKVDSRDETFHIADHNHTFRSLVDTGSQKDKMSAIQATILKKKSYTRNWVSFEDEDDNADISGLFIDLSHRPAEIAVQIHSVISDQHSVNNSVNRQLSDSDKDSSNSEQTSLCYRQENSEADFDILAHIQPLADTVSLKQSPKGASTPIAIQEDRISGHNFRNDVASPVSSTHTRRLNLPLHSQVAEKDASLLQHKRLMLLRPHSVDIPMRVATEISDLPADFLDTPKTSHQRRAQFVNGHTNSKYFSLPADSNLKPAVKDSMESNRHNGRPTIFRTSSSASLQGDSFVSTSVPIVPSGEPWKKTLKWISALMERKGTAAPMPIDDSMDFGLQPSLSPKDKIINAESSSFEAQNGSADKKTRNNLQLDIDTVIERGDADSGAKVETRTAVYKKRWYLLLLFSLSAMLWNAVWSTWGPIAQSAKDVYHWTDSDIAMFIWLGNIPFLLTMFPCSYLMDVKGMRTAMIVACGFMFLGTGFRCVPSDVTTATWLIRIGQFLNGMAGTIPNSAPALLSGLWFPPNQRASATAISTVAGYMGASVSFVIGPLLVPQPNDLLPVNNTDDLLSVDLDIFDISNMTNVTTYNAQKEGIMHILYAEFAVAGLLLLLVLIYFPSKPPLPPSVSASMPREKYIPGLKMLVRNKQFWVCAMAFSVPAGVYEAWQVILDVILDDKGVSQQTAGWLDFYATVGGCVSGLLVCRFADFFTRQMKLFLLVFYFFAAVSILWFTLVVFDILPFDRVSMYAAIIIGGVFLDGGGPLFFELTIEVSYPVGEGVTSGFTQMLCAAAGIVFLSVVQVESLGKEWINWYFFGCVAMAIPPLFFISTTYGRADLDDADEEEEVGDETVSADTDEKTYLFGSSHV